MSPAPEGLAAHAEIATEHGARYMTQLAKHWSHRFEVALDAHAARIALPMGPCILSAGPGSLAVRVETAAETDLARMEEVVAVHLQRFAFREELKIVWARA